MKVLFINRFPPNTKSHDNTVENKKNMLHIFHQDTNEVLTFADASLFTSLVINLNVVSLRCVSKSGFRYFQAIGETHSLYINVLLWLLLNKVSNLKEISC